MYHGIIISGNDIAECGKIAKKLEDFQIYKIIRVGSDRKEKSYYAYIEKEKLAAINDEFFLLKNKMPDEMVAIFMQEFKEIVEGAMIPIIIIDRDAVEIIGRISGTDFKFMSFYIYNENEDNKEASIYDKNNVIAKFNYSIDDKSVFDVAALIDKLWNLRERGGGLSRDLMNKLVKCNLLIKDGKLDNVSNSSYDLTLGDEYYYAGEIKELSEKKPFLAIEPYDYVIASCSEKINMPRDVSGRFDVSVNLFCQGIILSNSTQVDPGFRGKLFCLLFNTSNKVVYLKRHTHFVTMEFNKLVEPTTPYNGKYADEDSIVPYLPTNVMQGAINELKKEIENLKIENQKMQSVYLSVLALFLAIVSIFLTLK